MIPLPKSNPIHKISPLYDNHGRKIDYLRLAITDRCNLRCCYCMPEEGIRFVPYREILRYEEMVRLVRLFTTLGIRKVRITGGEPFTRRDCLPFLRRIRTLPGVEELHVTTNGVVVAPHLDALKNLNISGINLSLDTLDPRRFQLLSRQDSLGRVLTTLYGILQRGIPLKINTVLLEDTGDEDILSLAKIAEDQPVTVRFIEKMPFSGGAGGTGRSGENLLHRLQRLFSLTEAENVIPSTARLFSIPGYAGKIGIIEGRSRTFCATCNKLRITPQGILKTCLYDQGVLDLKSMLRSGFHDITILGKITQCVSSRQRDGLQVTHRTATLREPSMATIGG